ncbi:helix-turn-helix domain-containing protein [Saccharopolyspora aridisoli]|uniref:helix-turn-helix domain-containing protein n=1 Tax=Saccharopolyspora aridisoli TaxID=2530385 RepID=UPI0038B4EDCB
MDIPISQQWKTVRAVCSESGSPATRHRYDKCVKLRYQFRLNSTPGQQAALARAFGCARRHQDRCSEISAQGRSEAQAVAAGPRA